MIPQPRSTAKPTVFLAGLLYFALILSAGFALGVVRELWLGPALGHTGAELLEMPLMVAVCYVCAGKLRHLFPALGSSHWLVAGIFALVLMLAAEGLLAGVLRGLSLPEYLATRHPAATFAYGLALALFALLPWWLSRRDQHSNTAVKRNKT